MFDNIPSKCKGIGLTCNVLVKQAELSLLLRQYVSKTELYVLLYLYALGVRHKTAKLTITDTLTLGPETLGERLYEAVVEQTLIKPIILYWSRSKGEVSFRSVLYLY